METIKEKLNPILHGVVNVLGNGVIFTILPDDWKAYAFVVFNVIQVVLAAIDPTYTVNLIKLGKINTEGK